MMNENTGEFRESAGRTKSRGRSSRIWQCFWLTFLFVSLGYAWYSFYVPANEVRWAEDYATAKSTSEETGKPMILYFSARWCVPCRIMKRTVWADSHVESTVNREFTPVIIDVNFDDAQEAIQRYEIAATPVTIITDPKGNVLERVDGALNQSDFVKLLDRVEAQAATK